MNTMKRNATPQNAVGDHHEDGEHLHFRLCHLCFHLNEADAEISQCEECNHLFKDEILTQFFDDQDAEAFTDAAPDDKRTEDSEEEDEAERGKFFGDVNGLSVRF